MIKSTSDNEALSLLSDNSFLQEWQRLYRNCPWATPFQSIGFVKTWYECYRKSFRPLIVYQFSPDGALQGLLPLALSCDSSQLVVAGAEQAEYQTWLTADSDDGAFIRDALALVRTKLPRRLLRFRYLPPKTPIESLTKDGMWKAHCRRFTVSRPLMCVGDGSDMANSLRKKSNKSRMNRLKSEGELCFRRLQTREELEDVFDEIIASYDERRQAMHECAPFAEDPQKKSFHLALMQTPDLLHATVLEVGGKVVASHLALCGKDTLHLAIITHSSAHEHHSPGKLLLLKLGLHMAETGLQTLDLTPGGDPWKERFANDRDEVDELTVFFDRWQALRSNANRQLRTVAKRMLQSVGYKR